MKRFLLLCTMLFCVLITKAQNGQLDPNFGNKGIVQTNIGAPYKYPAYTKQVLLQADGSMFLNLYGAFNGSSVLKRTSTGNIDSSFGINGYSFSPAALIETAIALQPDGQIVIAGVTNLNEPGLVRIKSNGTPDSTFGVNGYKALNFTPRAIAIQADGAIVIAGSSNDEGFQVARYLSNGSVDNSFNGSGAVIISFEYEIFVDGIGNPPMIGYSGSANAIAIQADGKIVVGGSALSTSGNVFAIARCNINGSPDNSFDSDGRQTTSIGSLSDIGYSLALQTDGKIILGGYTNDGELNRFAIARYTTTGSPDNTFSADGKQTAPVGSDMLIGNTVALQTNGSIVIAGYTFSGSDNDFALARFTTGGIPDISFGNNGILITDINGSDDYAGGIAIQADNKIVLAGYGFVDGLPTYVIVRYLSNGILDNSFDTDGKLVGNVNQGYTNYLATAVQTDGKIVTAGMAWNGNDYDFAVARYNPNGSLDNTFSADGKQVTDFGFEEAANAVVIQPDGKIIVAGSSNNQFAMVRYTSMGILDPTFDGDGKVTLQVGLTDVGNDVALQADGKIVMAGFSYTDPNFDSAFFAVTRFNTNGAIDNSFSADGKQFTSIQSATSFATSVSIQTDGKIVASGRSYINNQNNFSIARYNTDGTLDNSFSQDGKQSTVFGPDDYFGEAMAIQPDGKILVAGYTQSLQGESAFAVARFNSNGEVDNSFSNDGFQSTPTATNLNSAVCMAISNGRILLGGTNNHFTMVLYKSNGSLDSSFNGNGIQSTKLGLGYSSIRGISFAGNIVYAAGNGEFPGNVGVLAKYLLTDPTAGPLPETVLNFIGELQGKSVFLQWQTENTPNISGFILERSINNIDFSTLHNIEAKTNANNIKQYTVYDRQPYGGNNYYRLKILHKGGTFTYSNVITIFVKADNFKWIIYPNPAVDFIYVSGFNSSDKSTIQIFDRNGVRMIQVPVQVKGNASFQVNVSNLRKGLYFLELHTKNGTHVKSFIKQ